LVFLAKTVVEVMPIADSYDFGIGFDVDVITGSGVLVDVGVSLGVGEGVSVEGVPTSYNAGILRVFP
jgi:hypothetical protein